tara:strand:+ start:828 stop:941 length:114 start_codon:yes stop_codon:yes gene_type:complete
VSIKKKGSIIKNKFCNILMEINFEDDSKKIINKKPNE